MREGFSGKQIGRIYDEQAQSYVDFADESYSWLYLERPAFDYYISDFYNSNTRVLDLGCGGGRVSEYLVSKGVNPLNITGVDASEELLKIASRKIPNATFIHSSVENFDVSKEYFDIAISNMVFHHLDNKSLSQALDTVYISLKNGGTLFFVDTDPDHIPEALEEKNQNKWMNQDTPWGTRIPFFNRDPRTLLTDIIDLAGFDLVKGWTVPVIKEGLINPEKYYYYSGRPSRIAARYKKVSEERRELRRGPLIPNLLP